MTLKFNNNPTTSNTRSLLNNFKNSNSSPFSAGTFYVYDTATVPYPNGVPGASTLAANALATFTSFHVNVTLQNGLAYLSTLPAVNASVTGNIGWWAWTSTTAAANNTIISNSVSIYGGNAIATFSSMTTTAGSELVLTSFTLKFSHLS